MEFEYQLPTKVIFGINATAKLKEELDRIKAKKVLVVTDKGVRKAGLVDKVVNPLGANFEVNVFDDVEPNPRSSTIEKGVKEFADKNIDAVIGVGGGSSIDSAKAIALRFTNSGHILDYKRGGKPIAHPPKPIIAIPTTAGTGSEVTFASMITDEVNKMKVAVFSPQIAPAIAIVDPLMTINLPPEPTIGSGADALTHAIEAYISINANFVSDALSLMAIKLISSNLREVVGNGQNITARSNILLASTMAGMAFTNVGLGIVHSLAHPLSGILDTPHGMACGILLPYVMRWNLVAVPSKFASIAEAMGEDVAGLSPIKKAKKAVEAVQELLIDIGVPQNLKQIGVDEPIIPKLVEQALVEGLKANPRRQFSKEIAFGIYMEALSG
jgi:alcohol dehydrogenase class IV